MRATSSPGRTRRCPRPRAAGRRASPPRRASCADLLADERRAPEQDDDRLARELGFAHRILDDREIRSALDDVEWEPERLQRRLRDEAFVHLVVEAVLVR